MTNLKITDKFKDSRYPILTFLAIIIVWQAVVEIKDIPGDIIIIIMNVLSIFLVIISYAAVAFVIWGGIQYVISNGDQAKVSSAKNTIQRALIGLLISLAAVAIVNTVSSSIGAGV